MSDAQETNPQPTTNSDPFRSKYRVLTEPEKCAIEAVKENSKAAWRYRAIRFSDSDLFVQHRGKEVWSSVRDTKNTLHFNPDHTYRLIRDRFIDELPEVADTTKEKP